MASPFKKYANATLTIPITVSGEYNPDTMSYEESTVYQDYQVLLEPSRSALDTTESAGGLDINTLLMKGRLVSPQIFDTKVKFPAHCTVLLKRENQRGKIEISLTPLSPYFKEDKLLGTPFVGTLVYE